MGDQRTRVAIDLFSGGGGMSLGLKAAGFLVSGAVEIEPEAAKTYTVNHPSTTLFQKDIRSLTGSELIKTSPTGKIDLIAACPPCQGFSSLTSKYKRDDPRNELVFEFERLVREVRPAAFVMENVPGLSKKGAKLFDEVVGSLEEDGYKITKSVLDVANYGVPQRRRRLVVFGSLETSITLPEATHSREIENGKEEWLTVKDAIKPLDLGRPITMQVAKKKGGARINGWHVVRDLSERNVERLRATKAGKSRSELPDDLRPECHKGDYGGFSNVYGRMSWNQPSPTITGGCTTLSKGRFGHPSQLRTISVREAAALQTFPADYDFATDYMEYACQIIGNALPPKFAEVIAKQCLNHLKQNERKQKRV